MSEWFLFNVSCSTLVLFNINGLISGLGLCDNVIRLILRVCGGILGCCMLCCSERGPGSEIYYDLHGQVLQGEGHAHQEEDGQVDQEEHDDQLRLLEEGRGREADHQDR